MCMSTAASGDAARGRLIMKRQRQKKGGAMGIFLVALGGIEPSAQGFLTLGSTQ